MANPLIFVQSAVYGSSQVADAVRDVTVAVQALFDRQYQADNGRQAFEIIDIRPSLFGLRDLAPGRPKTFTIAYTTAGARGGHVFLRGGGDGQNLKLPTSALHHLVVESAFYGADTFGLDITQAAKAYFAEPASDNTLVVGGGPFLTLFCGGRDPAPGVRKFFSLTFRHSPAGHPIHICASDGQRLNVANDGELPNEAWMEDLAGLHPGFRDFPLHRICLPASHDSGTYSLRPQFTRDPKPWIRRAMDAIEHVNRAINIPGIGHFINPASWAYDSVMEVTQNFAHATRATLLQQLRDGIRCFDLRIYYNRRDPSNPFYTYHSVVGVPLAQILSEVAFFILSLAPQGEIVYLTLGHYLDDDNPPNHGFTPEIVRQLTTLIWSRLPDRNRVFGPRDARDAGRGDRLLECTYGEIVGAGAAAASKVILAIKDPPAADADKLWPAELYSPPDANPGSRFVGGYTKTDELAPMLADQRRNAVRARAENKPLALYLTLTPGDSTITVKIVTGLRNAVLVLLAWAAVVPFIGWSLMPALTALAVYLASLIAGEHAKYSSLRELASRVFGAANPTVMEMIDNRFTGADMAPPSFLYMDFYEDHTMPNGDRQKVAQLVEAAKNITVRGRWSKKPFSKIPIQEK